MTLLTRIEGGTGADRELDALLWARFDGRDVRYDGNTVLAKSRRPPHDECVIGWIDPGRVARNFSAASPGGAPAYTSSLDASLALVERMLPGWWAASIAQTHPDFWTAGQKHPWSADLHGPVTWDKDEYGYPEPHFKIASSSGISSAPRAVLVAVLRALQEPSK